MILKSNAKKTYMRNDFNIQLCRTTVCNMLFVVVFFSGEDLP